MLRGAGVFCACAYSIRNNNPLNIRRSATRWQGARKEQTDKSFVRFESMAYGYRAAWKILQSYYERFCAEGKPFTVRNIISRWAPPMENDTGAYIISVLKLESLGGNERMLPPGNVSGYGRLSRMVAAMTVIECGIAYSQVDHEAIAQGYRLAFPSNCRELDEWLLGRMNIGIGDKKEEGVFLKLTPSVCFPFT